MTVDFSLFPYEVDLGIDLEIRPGTPRDEVLESTFKLSDVNIWLSEYECFVDYIRVNDGSRLTHRFSDPNIAVLFKLTFGGNWVHEMNLPD